MLKSHTISKEKQNSHKAHNQNNFQLNNQIVLFYLILDKYTFRTESTSSRIICSRFTKEASGAWLRVEEVSGFDRIITNL